MYKFGTVVLVPFPFTDLTSTKLRPALIISKTNQKSEDVILAFITSKKSLGKNASHFFVSLSDRYGSSAGLKSDSFVRFDKIATLSKKLILGETGAFHPSLLKQMQYSFRAAFGF